MAPDRPARLVLQSFIGEVLGIHVRNDAELAGRRDFRHNVLASRFFFGVGGMLEKLIRHIHHNVGFLAELHFVELVVQLHTLLFFFGTFLGG